MQQIFQRATTSYNSGDYEQALILFRQAAKNPEVANQSIRNQGLCEFKLRKFRNAIKSLNIVKPMLGNDPMLLEALGLSHLHLKSFDIAITTLLDRLSLPGEFSSSCFNGLLLCTQQSDLLEDSLTQLQDRLTNQNNLINLRITFARLLSENMRYEEAVSLLNEGMSDDTHKLQILLELGQIEKSHQHFQNCEKHWMSALRLAEKQKNYVFCEKLLLELLQIHSQAGKASSVRQLCANLLRGFPTDENRIKCLAACVEKSMHQEVEEIALQIQDKSKYSKEILIARTRIARDKQDISTAIGNTLELLQRNPQDATMLCNLGLLLADCGQPEIAAAAYTRALEIRPDYSMAKWNLAISYFLRGFYREAFELAENRWQLEHLMGKRPRVAPELVRGEQIAGKSIFVYYEQGLGDTLQFCRFAETLRSFGAEVHLRVQPPLIRLIKTSFPNIHVLDQDEEHPTADRQIALLSIPYILHCDAFTIPSPYAYLKPDYSKKKVWNQTFSKDKRPIIGLAWSGSDTHKNDHNRSIQFEMLEEILRLPAQFVAVQKDVCIDTKFRSLSNFYCLSEQLEDFNDTAQLMQQLDLIVSVDSSPAHLAGAIGKPVWLLLPRPCDWRWTSSGNNTIWYQNMRIFRQDSTRKWKNILSDLRLALIEHFNIEP